MIDKEFFIFGQPVSTPLCEVRFLKYFEYIENLAELSLMSLNTLHIYYQYSKSNVDNDPVFSDSLEGLKQLSLFEIIKMKGHEHFIDAYFKIFKLVIDDIEVIEAIFDDEKLFMQYRKLVMDMQILHEETVSPNFEIQKGIERSRRVKQKDAEKQSYSDIISSVVAGTSNSFNDIGEMTVLQVYSIYYRISAIFNYQASTLFATVAEKVKIESWNKHIDLWHVESDTIDREDFNKQYGSMF